MKKNFYLKALKNSSPEKLAQLTSKKSLSDAFFLSPKNEVQASLMKVMKKVLNVEQIGIDTNLVTSGLNSLKIVQAISSCKKELGVKLSFEDFLDNPDIERLAKITGLKKKVYYQDIQEQEVQENYELSHAQKRIWISHHTDGQQLTYNIITPYLIEGELNIDALNKAFRALSDRHDSLRTNFVEIEGSPKQIINPTVDWEEMSVTDLSKQENAIATALDVARNDIHVPFQLVEGPMFRTQLLKVEEKKYIFVLTIHHLITDGLSMDIFLHDLSLFYLHFCGEKIDLPEPLAIQYKDYCAWEQHIVESEPFQLHKDYWLSIFNDKGGRSPINLPTDFPRPQKEVPRGMVVHCDLSEQYAKSLEVLRARYGTTFFMTLFAVLNAFLHRLTGQNEIVIGFPMSGRSHPILEKQIGLYINTIASKTTFGEGETYHTLIRQVRENILNALKHGAYPFDLLVNDMKAESSNGGRYPLFDVMVTFQNAPERKQIGEGLSISKMRLGSGVSMFDLSFDFYLSSEGLYLEIEYNMDIFEYESIILFYEQLKILIKEMCKHPEKELKKLEFEYPSADKGEGLNFDLDF